MSEHEQFSDAVVNNRLALVDSMLRKNKALGSCARDKWGWPPMHSAVRQGYRRMLRVLARHGVSVDMPAACNQTYFPPELVFAVHDYEFTPLELAVHRNNKHVVAELIRLGAHVNESQRNVRFRYCRMSACDEQEYHSHFVVGETAFQYAARRDNTAIVTCIRTK